MVEEDERFLVVNGRRWRRADPSLPDDVVSALTSHLGRARNAVKQAKRAGDEDALASARGRVQVAKVGLGERSDPWWELSEEARQERAREAVEQLEESGG
ncbi:biopolymer transporter Tol [Brevibacterium yomogidense]|uniref:biopolymer transporter Tol n=1 Tax=Brevibacterium yomogidense TaxID=946573 RepID=UPI0018E0509B|nr:biopolymer transporter Tol [Brevibacterium yomogidense]